MSFAFNFPAPDEGTHDVQPFTFGFANPDSGIASPFPIVSESSPEKICDLTENFDNAPMKEHAFHTSFERSIPAQIPKTSQNSSEKSAETKWNTFAMDDVCLHFLCPEWIDAHVVSSRLTGSSDADEVKTDIIPKVYEGGFRVWDGACDVLAYLISEAPVDFQGKKVLELGCGAGLPGIFALKKGATVHFHDYNADVIEGATIPNIQKNVANAPKNDPSNIRLFSGDWLSFVDCLHVGQGNNDRNAESDKYDIILTGDTVYRRDVLSKLAFVLPRLLRKNGTIYLAGKSIYFGLDGGTDEFRREIAKENFLYCVDSKVYPDCVQREVLVLKRT